METEPMEAAVLTESDQAMLAFHRKKFARYYKPGLLKVDHHLRLVERLSKHARQANIPEVYIYGRSMLDVCQDQELDYVKHFRRLPERAVAGLMYLGQVPELEERLYTLAGAVTRNMINVRVLMIQDLMESLKDGDPPNDTLVIVPNFFLGVGKGGDIPDWQATMLVGWLLSRFSAGKQTLVVVSDLLECRNKYGSMVADHLENHYIAVTE